MAKNDDKKAVRCSFCGKTQSMVERLIAGNGSFICDECIRLCMSIIDEDYESERKPSPVKEPVEEPPMEELPKPAEIKAGPACLRSYPGREHEPGNGARRDR